MRGLFVLLHRYIGLTLAVFLVIIGVTGCVIAFFNELDGWLNAELLTVSPQGSAMDALALRDKMEAEDPRAHFFYIHFPASAEKSINFYTEGAIDPATGEEYEIDHDELFANPYTGERLGSRLWGHFSFERKDLVTFLYYLHYSLVLPEALGEGFMGIVALVWAGDCFVGFYLTLPRRRRRRTGNESEARRLSDGARARSFWQRWKPAWRIKTDAGPYRVVYDLHRASGLWVWPMLLVFAWSGFAFNLPETYTAVMSRVTKFEDIEHPPELVRPLSQPSIGWSQALAFGQHYMAEQARLHDFTINRPSSLIYRRETGVYYYRVHSSRDLFNYGATSVAIDATTGAFRGVKIPTGQHAGNTFTTWIMALHMAMVFGLPMQIFVSVMGLTVAMLTVTGVVVWLKKRRARRRFAECSTLIERVTSQSADYGM